MSDRTVLTVEIFIERTKNDFRFGSSIHIEDGSFSDNELSDFQRHILDDLPKAILGAMNHAHNLGEDHNA